MRPIVIDRVAWSVGLSECHSKGCEFGNFRKFSAENFRKFIPIFPEISGNFLESFFFLCQSAISKSSDALK